MIELDGSRFRVPASTSVVELSGRANLKRLLLALAEHHERERGGGIPDSDLVALVWPGERLVARAATNRLHNALSSLRRLGLKDWIERSNAGYRLRSDLVVRFAEGIKRVKREPRETRAMKLSSYGLLLAALVGCGSSSERVEDASVPGDTGTDGVDAGVIEVHARCTLTQSAQTLPTEQLAAAATEDAFFIGDRQGLWRGISASDRMVRVTTVPRPDLSVTSIAALDDGRIFVATGSGPVFESDSGGDAWIERPYEREGEVVLGLRSDGVRLVGVVGDPSFPSAYVELDGDGRWVPFEASPPPPGCTLIGFDGDGLACSGGRTDGVYRLATGAPAWEPIPGLVEWGYYSFARMGDVRLTTSASGIRVEGSSGWDLVVDRPMSVFVLDVGSEGVLAVDSDASFASPDGVTFTALGAGPGISGPVELSRAGDRVAVHSGGSARLSDDGGASFVEPPVVSESLSGVALRDGARYAIDYGSSRLLAERGGVWSLVEWRDPYVGGFVVVEDGAWGCNYEGCAHRSHEGVFGPLLPYPDDTFGGWGVAAFSTSYGLFIVPNGGGLSGCGGPVRPGPMRLSTDSSGSATWTDASVGIPRSPATGACARYEAIVEMAELNGVLYATTSPDTYASGAEHVVLASTDGGQSWTEVLRDDSMLTAAESNGVSFALLENRGVVVLEDVGAFRPVAAQPPGTITDLVTFEGYLVASTLAWDGTPSVWISGDGGRSFRPLEADGASNLGPIAALDARGPRLGLASRTSGLWEATDCFGR